MAIRKEAKGFHFLKEINLFEGLGNPVVNRIFRLGLVQNFKKGDFIIREGEGGGNLHILIVGKAEVVKSAKGRGKKGKQLARIGRGSVFGEMSVFDGAPYSASVRALEDCDVHIIRGSDFRRFLEQHPSDGVGILVTLITSVSNRLRRANLALSVLGR